MSFLQVQPYVCFTSSSLSAFYKFDLMPVWQVRPFPFLQLIEHIMSFLQGRSYVFIISSTLYLFTT